MPPGWWEKEGAVTRNITALPRPATTCARSAPARWRATPAVSTMASPAVVAHPRWRAPCAARHGTTSRRSSGLRCGCGRCPAALTILIPALPIVDECLRGRSCWLVNYARRYRAGLRVGTSVTEGTANFLVNRRMNKSQQMRWSPSGADLLLQVRCAVFNGTFGSGFGHLFQPHAN